MGRTFRGMVMFAKISSFSTKLLSFHLFPFLCTSARLLQTAIFDFGEAGCSPSDPCLVQLTRYFPS